MGWDPFPELCLQDRVGQDFVVEQSFEAVKRLVTAGMLVQGLGALRVARAGARACAAALTTGVAHVRYRPSASFPNPASIGPVPLHGPASVLLVNDGLGAGLWSMPDPRCNVPLRVLMSGADRGRSPVAP